MKLSMSFTGISLTNGEGWYIVYYSLAKADPSPGLAKCILSSSTIMKCIYYTGHKTIINNSHVKLWESSEAH